jgi:hypothetical protein
MAGSSKILVSGAKVRPERPLVLFISSKDRVGGATWAGTVLLELVLALILAAAADRVLSWVGSGAAEATAAGWEDCVAGPPRAPCAKR